MNTPKDGISVNVGHPQGCALKPTLNLLGRLMCSLLQACDSTDPDVADPDNDYGPDPDPTLLYVKICTNIF
jgi:hypothetical protein